MKKSARKEQKRKIKENMDRGYKSKSTEEIKETTKIKEGWREKD